MMFRGAKWTTERILARINGRRIKSLDLYNTAANDDLLIALSEVGSLTSFDVSSSTLTDNGVRTLVRKCGLRSLLFREAPLVTDQSMAEISRCASLRELYLEGTGVTDEGVGYVASLPNLWSLDISRTQVTDDGIKQIASKQIHLINFHDTKITGVGFSTWSVCDKMSFYTERSSLNDEGFSEACKALTQMWNIVLEHTKVTNSGLRAFEGQHPTMVRLHGSKVDREGVIWLIENTEVQAIETDPTQFSEADVERYRDYRRYLRISVYEK